MPKLDDWKRIIVYEKSAQRERFLGESFVFCVHFGKISGKQLRIVDGLVNIL